MAGESGLQGVDVGMVDFLRNKLRKLKTKMAVVFGSSKVHHNLEILSHADIEKDYKFSKDVLGEGRFGCVRVCKDRKTGARFICKSILKSRADDYVYKERDILKYLNSRSHPAIMSFTDFYEDSKSFHLVMELCNGGSLQDGRVTEHEAAIWMKQIMSAIKYCHDMGVVHRDVKPENILFTSSGSIKLVDFRSATRISRDVKLSSVVGTPEYVAPEIVNFMDYTEKVDIWSAGVILYNLLSGTKPYPGNSFEKVVLAMMHTDLNFDGAFWEGVTPEARDLVGKMLCRDPSLRLSAGQVLNHPWITIHTIEALLTNEITP